MQHIRELLNRIESIDNSIMQLESYLEFVAIKPSSQLKWTTQIGLLQEERKIAVNVFKLAVEAL